MKIYSGLILFVTFLIIILSVYLFEIEEERMREYTYIFLIISGLVSGYIEGFKGMKSALLVSFAFISLYLFTGRSDPFVLIGLIVVVFSIGLFFAAHAIASLAYKPND